MRASSLSLLVAIAPTALGCTFGFTADHYFGSWGGGNSVRCTAVIWESDSPDFKNEKSDAAVDLGCSGGCQNLEYKGKTYEFCYDSASNNEFSGDATIRRVDGGVKVNIVPDGEKEKWRFVGGVSSIEGTRQYRSNIGCPSA